MFSRILGSLVVATLVIGASAASWAGPPEVYRAKLSPLNDSGVNGHVLLKLDGNELTVKLQGRGLEPDKPHPQHIHGFADGTNATTPTLAQDDDGDGFIELAEGLDTYGPILLPLTSPPGGALEDFPTAPKGKIHFQETYVLSEDELETLKDDLTLNEIVVHGMSLEEGDGENGGEADGTAGYKVVLPVASGVIVEQGQGNSRKGKKK